jgi:hypothetical protein
LSDIQRRPISPGDDPMKKIARIVMQWLRGGKASQLPEVPLPCQISGQVFSVEKDRNRRDAPYFRP